MEINVRDDMKLVDIWLTNTEKDDPEIQTQLRELYGKYRKNHCLVAVYQSGSRSLYEATLALLVCNKGRAAELDVQRSKRKHTAAAEG